MADLPPGLLGYRAAVEDSQRKNALDLQNLGGLLSLQSQMEMRPLQAAQLRLAIQKAADQHAALQRIGRGGQGAAIGALSTGAMQGDVGPTVGNEQRMLQTADSDYIEALRAGVDPKTITAMRDIQMPKMEVNRGYAFDPRRVSGFLPGIDISQNGQAVGVMPTAGGGLPTISALPGSIPAFSAFRQADEQAKAQYDPFMGQVDKFGRPIPQTRLNFINGVTQPSEPQPLPKAQSSPVGSPLAIPPKPVTPRQPREGMGPTPAESAFSSALMGDQAKAFTAHQASADSSAKAISTMHEARQLLDQGVITGAGAEFATSFGNWLAQAGVKMAEEPVANTQAFMATQGRQVLQIIKNLGSGSGISDADREYAAKIVGGQITASEPAIRRLLDIGERAARADIQLFNKKAEAIKGSPAGSGIPYDLIVPEPKPYTPRPKAPTGIEYNGYRFPSQEALNNYKKAAGLP